jgi:hypothetical protein
VSPYASAKEEKQTQHASIKTDDVNSMLNTDLYSSRFHDKSSRVDYRCGISAISRIAIENTFH